MDRVWITDKIVMHEAEVKRIVIFWFLWNSSSTSARAFLLSIGDNDVKSNIFSTLNFGYCCLINAVNLSRLTLETINSETNVPSRPVD